MTDLISFEKALKTSWIKEIIMPRNIWKICLRSIFVPNQWLTLAEVEYINSALVETATKLFWKQLYRKWNEILCKTGTPMNVKDVLAQLLWNNPQF